MVSPAARLAGVGVHGIALFRLHQSAPPAGVLPAVTGQGRTPFPLRWSAAVRVALLPCRSRSGEAGEGPEDDNEEPQEMVFVVLSKEAEHSLALLSRVPPSPEEMYAAADLKKYFSDLATAATKGEIDKSVGVRALIGGVHRLIELAYKPFPSAPRVTAPTTEEAFVQHFMGVGEQFPEISSAFAFTENMGQYPEDGRDRGYLTSMVTSMNLARLVVTGLTSNLDILRQLPVADMTSFTLPELPAPQDAPDQSPSDGMDSSGGTTGAE